MLIKAKLSKSFVQAKVAIIVFFLVSICASQCFAQAKDAAPAKTLQQLRDSENSLIEKLNRKEIVSKEDVVKIMDSWRIYDYNRNQENPVDQKRRYEESLRFTKDVLPMVKDNSILSIYLNSMNATILVNSGMPDEAIISYKKSLSDIEKIKYDADYKYVNTWIALGGAYTSNGQKSEADSAFSEAASYPWYGVPEPYFQDFRALYETSLRALITLRRYDRKALKRIYLPPAFEKELGSQLANALNEVGGP